MESGRAAGAQSQSSTLPAGILARVNGREITLDDYSRFLVLNFGLSQLQRLIDRVLVEEEASRLGIRLRSDDVDKEVQSRVEDELRQVFVGDRARYEAELKRRGLSIEERREQLRQDVSYELLGDACILAVRRIAEVAVKERFESLYGDGGVLFELRHILVACRAPGREKDSRGRDLPTEEEARSTAEKLRREVIDGAEFGAHARAHSDDELTSRNDGRLPVYRTGQFGEEFHRAVLGLSATSRVSDVVRSSLGFHIIYLIRREETRLEDKRVEILKYLESRRPDAEERQDFIRRLRANARVER